MKTVVSSLHFQIPAGAAPEWVHLTPAGTFRGGDGRGPFTLEGADDVIRASMSAGKIPLDENHSIDLAAPEGRPAPARGWIVEMQSRADGLWGRVEWTATGRRLVEEGDYRGISPVLMSTKGGKLLKILRASLVNDPNLPLTTLHNRENDMDFLAKLRKALGLTDDAAEDAVLTTVTSHAAIAAAQGKPADHRIAEAAGLKPTATVNEVVTHLQAKMPALAKVDAVKAGLKAAGLDVDTATPEQITAHFKTSGTGDAELRQTVISLQSQLTTLQVDTAKKAATAFVDAAITAGKPIKPLRDHYIARHQKDAAGVETEINALVSIHGGSVKAPKTGEAGALDADENAIVSLMGLDPKKFAETKAELDKTAL
jgi:phage I-like protein